MIYFDNAATTFKKPRSVIKSVNECLVKYCANAGRGAYDIAVKTSDKIYEAREKIAGLLGIQTPERVVFTQNATHALNLAIKSSVVGGSHILISDLEHNAVYRPVYSICADSEIEYSLFSTRGDIEKNITSQIRNNTRYLVSTLCSNVNGSEISLEILSRVAKKHNLMLIVDASQLIGHKTIDLSKTPCDILCAPSHKALFGIQGAGFAVFCDDVIRKTLFEGGSGSLSKSPEMPTVLPERFEAGTLSAPAIISLIKGIEFIEDVGLENIECRLSFLSSCIADRLKSIKEVVIHDYSNGVISFNVLGMPASDVSEELNKYGVCTRSGLHCAPLAHRRQGTESIGSVRVSLSYFNTKHEADKFYKIIKEVVKTK